MVLGNIMPSNHNCVMLNLKVSQLTCFCKLLEIADDDINISFIKG